MPFVVSGIGLVTPLGNTREETWEKLVAGQSAIQFSDGKLWARAHGFSSRENGSRTTAMVLCAAHEALQQAGVTHKHIQEMRIGCSVSISKPNLYRERTNSLSPAMLLGSFYGLTPGQVLQEKFRLQGPVLNVVAACATGIASLKQGLGWLGENRCDMVLVGAAESSLNDFFYSGFHKMGVLARGNDKNNVCPFDANRSGFSMGEGACVMVIENSETVHSRRSSALAEIKSVCLEQSTVDSIHFDPDGRMVAHLIEHTVGNIIPDTINAHGTATVFNDLAETKGIKKAFPNHYSSIKVSSTKAATGHLLGAAGAVEAAFAVLSIRDQRIPPTLHLNHPDPDCDLDYVPNQAHCGSVCHALSLSYGFGGQMGGVLFSAL